MLNLIIVSDVHGRLVSETRHQQNIPGLDRLSTYLKNLKSKNEEIFFLSNGDAIQGTPLVDLFDYQDQSVKDQEHPVNLVHRYMNLDCFVPGNHEFNFGLQHLKQVHSTSQNPWLAANIHDKKTGQLLFEPYRVFKLSSMTVGVIGVITDFVVKWESNADTRDLIFSNAVEACQRFIPEVRKKCDLLIISYHGGLNNDPETGETWNIGATTENQGLEIWKCSDDIDLLVTGHQHRKFIYQNSSDNRAIIIQPSSYARHWVHFKVHKNSESTVNRKSNKIFIETVPGIIDANDHRPDPEVKNILQSYLDKTETILNTALGKVDQKFLINEPMKDVWTKKHPMIQWINNLMCKKADVEVSAIPLLNPNLKGFSGEVTIRDVLEFFIFQDTLCVIRIDGKTLKSALEKSAEFFKVIQNEEGKSIAVINPEWRKNRVLSYNYDMWNGIEYQFDIGKPAGSRLVYVKQNGDHIADDQIIEAAVTSYRAAGAFYTMFSQNQIVREYPVRISDLMIENLSKVHYLDIEVTQNFKVAYE